MNSVIKILHQPIAIIFIPVYHSILELLNLINENLGPILKSLAAATSFFVIFSSLGYHNLAIWCLKWIGLGVLSSVGFGFGMHTFVLFLAPHIAAVTLAAHHCKSLSFPSPPYPKEITCPSSLEEDQSMVNFFDILCKVSLESFMWGFGTAIGELPPYLAARLRAQKKEDVTGGDILASSGQDTAGWELWMIKIIHKVGFTGILLCAAIPNPLFDAAGVASGIAQVPFMTFFGATFIGKAILKVTLQTSFVIFLFHNNNLDSLIGQLNERVCVLFPFLKDLNLQKSVTSFLDEQRAIIKDKKLSESKQAPILSVLFSWLISIMMFLFIVSVIINLDKQYRERKAQKASRRTE